MLVTDQTEKRLYAYHNTQRPPDLYRVDEAGNAQILCGCLQWHPSVEKTLDVLLQNYPRQMSEAKLEDLQYVSTNGPGIRKQLLRNCPSKLRDTFLTWLKATYPPEFEHAR